VAVLVRRLFIALRAVIYMSGFVLLWGWVALRVHVFDRSLGVALPVGTRILGVIFMGLGGILAFTCAGVFVAQGRGTPAPFDAPRNFVTVGPYRIRNPMYIGALTVLVGFGLYEHSVSILLLCLVGNLGKDPEIKHTASGVPVCRFSLATNETFKNKAGGAEKHTEWHSIVCFARLAEICGEYLAKGRQVYIEGSIRSRKWGDRDGNERKSYDIVARCMQMLSPSANGTETRSKETKPAQASQVSEEGNTFGQDEATEGTPF
jgi:single-strand DNA-binding protein